ncbi:MAG: hypothetical protein Q8830_04030, partial [Candidatus Phytoplasma australasiaticum]|nr:hypothetical protein [Candidatus Phytoplasma australasiaticum]
PLAVDTEAMPSLDIPTPAPSTTQVAFANYPFMFAFAFQTLVCMLAKTELQLSRLMSQIKL